MCYVDCCTHDIFCFDIVFLYWWTTSSVLAAFVGPMFLNSWSKCPYVHGKLSCRCFAINVVVNSGHKHKVRWPCLIACSIVDLVGLTNVAE